MTIEANVVHFVRLLRRAGMVVGPGDTLDIRIFQLSALVGRGAPASVTLAF